MGRNVSILFFAPLFLLLAGGVAAAEERIEVSADRLIVGDEGAKVEALGKVEVRRAETILRADEVRVNRKTQEAEAIGNVSVEDPEWRMKAEAARFNLERETGEIEKGEIFVERGHITLSGARFQKFPGQTYRVGQGFFTTCLCEKGPATWKIGAEEIELREDGMGVVRGSTFYLMDVPVLYVPYAFFPLRTERQTGFLFPSFGQSSRFGFRYEQPFFWAISKSSDATLGLDIETRSRVGLLGEYRTVFSRDARAHVNLSYFNEGLRKDEEQSIKDKTIADPEIPQNRWNLMVGHRHATPRGWTTYTDVSVFSDDLFARELTTRLHLDLESAQERALRVGRYGASRAGLFRSWGDFHLQAEWAFYQDFIQRDAEVPQRLPQLLFWGRRLVGASPLEFRWRAEAMNYLRDKGAEGFRFDLRPELVLPLRAAPYLFGSLSVAPQETFYYFYRTGASGRDESRELVQVRGSMGTSVARIFQVGGAALEKVKHEVEPEVSYLFIPDVAQGGIPHWDLRDRIRRRNVFTFSLTNRFWGRFRREAFPAEEDVELVSPGETGDVRELGRLKLALSYDLDRERKGGDSLSDLDASLSLRPAAYLSLGLDGGFDPGPWHATQATVSFSLLDPRPVGRRVLDRDFMRPNQLQLSYRFIRRGPNSLLAENANLDLDAFTCPGPDPRCSRFDEDVVGELGVRAQYRLSDRVLLLYDSSYDAREGRFTGNRAGIKLLSQCECWTVSFSVNRETNPSETSFRFGFNLLGLGSQIKELFK